MNDAIVGLLACLAQWVGSLGGAILVLSLGIRLAMLPLTVKLARRARRNQEILKQLQPEIDQLKKRFEKKPERLMGEMHNLYRKHHYNLFDVPAIVGSIIQWPIFAILYSGIRASLGASHVFLWIRNLASPDFGLTVLILALTGLSAYLMPSASEQMRNTLIAVQLGITLLIVWKLAAGLGLYWVSSNAVGVVQTLWLRHRRDINVRVR